MSKILILAPSGSGKSTSLRNLNPAVTAIINADKKELPLKGWRNDYVSKKNAAGKFDFDTSNYIETANPSAILTAIKGDGKELKGWENVPSIENIVIDTITHAVTNAYMTSTIGKDFKAYQALGKSFYDLIEVIRDSKKNIIVIGHAEKKLTDTGEYVWEMKSHGKMITDLVPASYFTTVLMGEKVKTDSGGFKYQFRTQSEGNDPAKSPAYVVGDKVYTALDMYEPNDVQLILNKLRDFEEN